MLNSQEIADIRLLRQQLNTGILLLIRLSVSQVSSMLENVMHNWVEKGHRSIYPFVFKGYEITSSNKVACNSHWVK